MNRQTRILVVTGAGALLLLLLILPQWNEQSAATAFRTPRYTRIVNEVMLPWLILSEAERPDDQGSQLRWDPEGLDARRAKIAEDFLHKSYLAQDIRNFNAPRNPADRLLFEHSEGKLRRISATAHTFSTPHARGGRWSGQLRYDVTAPGEALVLQSLTASQAVTMLPLQVLTEQVPQVDVLLFESVAGAEIDGAVVRFIARDIRSNEKVEVARAWRMGDGVIVKLKANQNSSVALYINGRRLRGKETARYVLSSGSVLLFRDEAVQPRGQQIEHAWMLRATPNTDVIYDATTGIWRNAGCNPLLPRVVDTFKAFAVSQGGSVSTPVTLTLVRSVEERAAEILRAATLPRRDQEQSPSAITLMDAMNGALLALPSQPVADCTSADAALSPPPPNYNLQRLAVGSVAKALFAAPILDVHPEYLGLTIRALPDNASGFRSVVGIPLGREVQDLSRGNFDLRRGIAKSNNRFAVTLLVLATDDAHYPLQTPRLIQSDHDRYELLGKSFDVRPPRLAFEPGSRSGDLSLTKVHWSKRLAELYEVSLSDAQLHARASAARTYIWDGRPQALLGTHEQRTLLDAISPEHENLRLDAIGSGDLGSKFVSLILGGAESRWTNVAVAEAFASIVRNQKVQASLVKHDVQKQGGDWRKLRSDVHRGLTAALREVVSSGTASEVLGKVNTELRRAACRKGEVFVLFGKTGSPELEELRRSPFAQIFEQMAAKGRFRQAPDSGLVYYAGSGDDAPLRREDLVALAAQRADQGEVAEDFAKFFLAPTPAVLASAKDCGISAAPLQLWDAVMRDIVVANNSTADPGSRIVYGEGKDLRVKGGVCGVPTPGNTAPSGKHFAFVAAVYRNKDQQMDCLRTALHADVDVTDESALLRAIAGVVAIADPQVVDDDRSVATRAACQLLAGPVAERLQLELPRSTLQSVCRP